jgi:glycosyltransferase involved in cell wall biosynthesis
MRVLVANIPLPANRFLVDLNSELGKICELVHDSEAFWKMQGDYDVVHLHFPEYITYAVERAYIEGLKPDLVAEVANRLRYWANRAKIIITRHVLLPHDALTDPAWEMMYETVYSFADGVVHFAQPSIDEFRNRYAMTVFHRGKPPLHTVIPHQNYASLPNDISRSQARRKLGIAKNASVVLVFGAIRNSEERSLILDMFMGLTAPNKLLLVSRWRETLANVSWIRLKYWLRDLKRLYYRLHPRFNFNYGFVEESDTQIYLNAADVLFIPRLRVLNSGNVTLGMTFGRVVVGPDSWDVGALLKETGNPVFDPDAPDTSVAAVEQGLALAKRGEIGAANRAKALAEWTPHQCAARYRQFYDQVTTFQE